MCWPVALPNVGIIMNALIILGMALPTSARFGRVASLLLKTKVQPLPVLTTNQPLMQSQLQVSGMAVDLM